MNRLVISGLFSAAESLIERFFPDPEKKAAAQLELLKMQQLYLVLFTGPMEMT